LTLFERRTSRPVTLLISSHYYIPERLMYRYNLPRNIATAVGDFMPADDKSELKGLEKKVDALSQELETIREDLKALGPIDDIVEKLESVGSELKDIGDGIKDLGGIEKRFDKMEKELGVLKGVADTSDISKSVENLEKSVDEILASKETEVIIKKLDDLLLYFTDSEVLVKKLDDLQSYVAGLSGLEEKVDELSNSLSETNEIVSIIVRQLDDIERKYNLTADKISDTADKVEAALAAGFSTSAEVQPEKKPKKEEPEPPKKPVSKASLPSTIDQIMNDLMDLVTSQTEAKTMAESLEEARDKLTTMISGHTPVLYQFGTKARELKSYPPTATLNENDIALLSKDIRSWTSKLKEMAKAQ
jgi:chromosome segregation ATPase